MLIISTEKNAKNICTKFMHFNTIFSNRMFSILRVHLFK